MIKQIFLGDGFENKKLVIVKKKLANRECCAGSTDGTKVVWRRGWQNGLWGPKQPYKSQSQGYMELEGLFSPLLWGDPPPRLWYNYTQVPVQFSKLNCMANPLHVVPSPASYSAPSLCHLSFHFHRFFFLYYYSYYYN